jgi:hypothetical protein
VVSVLKHVSDVKSAENVCNNLTLGKKFLIRLVIFVCKKRRCLQLNNSVHKPLFALLIEECKPWKTKFERIRPYLILFGVAETLGKLENQ